jgi:Predicted membrane protein (DUF2142)
MNRVASLLVAALGLLLVAWAIGNPAGAAPDEPAQLIRAMALATGDLGEEPQYRQPPASFKEEWFRTLTRSADVPARLVPDGQLPCFAFRPDVTADCTQTGTPFALSADERLQLDPRSGSPELIARLDAVEIDGATVLRPTSYQGAYPPIPLIIPGLVARTAPSAATADLMARLATVFCCLLILGIGWVLLLDGDDLLGPRVVGGLVALTPMVLFVASTVSASGIEIAAAFTWVCGLLSISRTHCGMSGRMVVTLGAIGAVLMSARQFGPLWLLISIVFMALFARRACLRLWSRQRRSVAVAGGLVAAGALFTVLWNLLVFPTPPPRQLPTSVRDRFGQGVRALGRLARELVGVFGWLDTTPPALIPLGWGVLACALVTISCLIGKRVDRLLLAALGAAVVTVALVGSWVAYGLQTGAQGRWILPVAVSIPTVAGEVVSRRWRSTGLNTPSGSVVTAAVLVAAGHLTCIWANSRRYAVGTHGPLFFAGVSRWHPPGGWLEVVIPAVLGGALIVAAGSAAASIDRRALDD